MDSRVIKLTTAAHKHGNLNIRTCGLGFFPKGILGGSTKAKLGNEITVKAEGLPDYIKTDIPTDRNTGRPRWIFRRRSWVKKFVRYHNLKPNESVRIKRINEKTYEVIPENNNGQGSTKQRLRKTTGTRQVTSEERRVEIYQKHFDPTKASDVTHDTPLERLNLNWREKDLREKERTKHVHRLHPYLGKYIPQLVEIFLRKYFTPGQTVLDPFVGSGTTSVQANELGINSIGYDVSAFNILLARVKAGKYDLIKARKEVLDVLNKVRLATQIDKRQAKLFVEDLPDELKELLSETDSEYLKEWFAPRALRELLTYRYFIKIGTYYYLDLLKVILSRSARSARLTTHFDLDFPKNPQRGPYWCYKHSRTCSPIKEAFKFLRRYSLDTLMRIEEFARVRTDASVELYHADSRKVRIPPIDGVMTSPPYVGLIDYHDQHAYSYHLLGLPRNCHNEIGPASKGRSEEAKRQYKHDIAAVFHRVLDAMKSGGHLVVVAHDRANLYSDIANSIGVEVEDIVRRHVNRRTGRRAGSFFESVYIWRKR
ncbi:MAG TPA: class I SAM-dependent methyltransferase [Planctomycetes bacterium]|nr:class I SAM-dependent methyltransferase [Planctomycetota bacterium]